MHHAASSDAIETWGGIECTVNRVGDRYFDQVELSGHSTRTDDIARIASLGIRTVRYPLLWERIAPGRIADADWRWTDERLEELDRHSITPVAGLLHHGSGPRSTSLLDPDFPRKFAEFAAAVAHRYPHLRFVTPINEPLTTARFSTLYGTWYPHTRSSQAFAAALLNQCVATRDAMRAMRESIPGLQLVQTEDIGRISSTPSLSYQAEFENHRRWLTFDLLCGHVAPNHAMWSYLASNSHHEAMLTSLYEDPYLPDVIGLNYYVTSDRFLDDRLEHYAASAVGGNGRHSYADIEAVRVAAEGISGHQRVLEDAWNRYRIPLAITELHMGCTREHQMRWLIDGWNGARAARANGADVRAVTAWALFGSFGWDNLVTREPLTYECGAFDVRSTIPRETAIAQAIRELARSSSPGHAAADSPGWWKQAGRFSVPPLSADSGRPPRPRLVPTDSRPPVKPVRPILITGARGTLGSAFERICEARGLAAHTVTRDELDIADALDVRDTIESLKPWAVINGAGYVRVDDAECNRTACYRANTFAVGILAAECARANIPLVTFSSDLVFDGLKREPYIERDRVSPLSAYGASKAAAELAALRLNEKSLVIRTSAFFGPWDQYNFAVIALQTLLNGVPFPAADDCIVSPTYVPDLVNAALDLLIDGEHGVWHLANSGSLTWTQLAREVAGRAGIDDQLIRPSNTSEMGFAARRPAYSALGSERGAILPSLESALDRWFGEVQNQLSDTFVTLHT